MNTIEAVDEAKVEAVAGVIVSEAKAVEAEASKVAERTTQELSEGEKLYIREIENEYLKAQIEINRLSAITQGAQKKFTEYVENLTRKYVINPAEMVFDNVSLTFRTK